MKIYDIRVARTQLGKLVDLAAAGEPFVISKDGKPMVQVTALETPTVLEAKRFGFMAGQIRVPDDFNTMGVAEIQRLFKG